jgi:hypothetical protein
MQKNLKRAPQENRTRTVVRNWYMQYVGRPVTVNNKLKSIEVYVDQRAQNQYYIIPKTSQISNFSS